MNTTPARFVVQNREYDSAYSRSSCSQISADAPSTAADLTAE